MEELGLKAYRFSISWSRVLPEGTGRVNHAGLDFYERLVDALLARTGSSPAPRSITGTCRPRSTTGAAGSIRDIADWFADYASVLFRALDGRVRMWATLNEPWVVTDGGYLHGVLAPGHRSLFEAPHRVPQPAARAWRGASRPIAPRDSTAIGIVVNLEPQVSGVRRPKTTSPRPAGRTPT